MQATNTTSWKEIYLNEEGKPEDGSREKEEIFFDSISKRIEEVVKHFKEHNPSAMRANHARIIAGFTGAQLQISSNIPADLQYGFLIPGKSYPVTIRFSNANGAFNEDDSKPDLRGVALRIQTENGRQDFLMTNAEEHHAKDAREAMMAIEAGVEKDIIAEKIPGHLPLEDAIAGMVGALPFLVKHLGLNTAWRIAQTLKKQMKIPVESLHTETFWSRAPLAIGNIPSAENSVALKYRLFPAVSKSEKPEEEKNLKKKLENELNLGDVTYFLQVQRFIDEEQTPVEDATKAWTSDFETVATLIIPQNAAIENDIVDQINFNPWNIDLQNFLPIGSMNRSRKKVYAASVRERQSTR